jgi:hypothetical protein
MATGQDEAGSRLISKPFVRHAVKGVNVYESNIGVHSSL